jgi:DnaJ-class molecular chaperone
MKSELDLAQKFHPNMTKTNINRQIYTTKFRSFANAYKLFQNEETKADYNRMLYNSDYLNTHKYPCNLILIEDFT